MKIFNVYTDFHEEQGFTIVELLISTAIISILGVMAISAFTLYKDNAEYSKAVSDLRNARTAAEVGLQEAEQAGATYAMTYSVTTGGAVSGGLENILPGASTTPGVRVGAMVVGTCSSSSSAQSQVITAVSCNSSRYTSWFRQCDGTEVQLHDQDASALGWGC